MAENIATSISDHLTQFLIITDHKTSQVLKIIESSLKNSKIWSIKSFLPNLVEIDWNNYLNKDQNNTDSRTEYPRRSFGNKI